jgi:cyclophilin family peptidyl-prolyl cis-trans isomerase
MEAAPTTQPEPLAADTDEVEVEAATTAPAPVAPAAPVAATQEAGPTIRAIIETNFGHMEAELWPDRAPITVANFVRLAKSGFYENLPSHRMIPGFILQLGKPVDVAKKRELEPFKGEFSEDLKHEAGTVSMARRPSDPDSATCQFFICFKPKNDIERRALATLDGQYAIFGKVVRGLDVLDAIEAVPTTTQPMGPGRTEPSKPTRTILLRNVRIPD